MKINGKEKDEIMEKNPYLCFSFIGYISNTNNKKIHNNNKTSKYIKRVYE